jgi:hypothetical protein
MNRRNFLTKAGFASLLAGIPALALSKRRKHISEEPVIHNAGRIKFWLSDGEEEILTLCPGGNIYVRGYLADNDKEVVDAFKEFVLHAKRNQNT